MPTMARAFAQCAAQYSLPYKLDNRLHGILTQRKPPERRTSGEGAEHAERGAGDSVHVGQAEADEDDDGEHDGGDDARLVAQRQAEDDVGRRAGAACVSDGLQSSVEEVGSAIAGNGNANWSQLCRLICQPKEYYWQQSDQEFIMSGKAWPRSGGREKGTGPMRRGVTGVNCVLLRCNIAWELGTQRACTGV